MSPAALTGIAALCLAMSSPRAAQAQSLDGSSAAVERAYKIALELDVPFFESGEQIQQRVKVGKLVKVLPNANLTLHRVSFPVALPAVARFLRKLATGYQRACGEQLVVTSLTRPVDKQPRNASGRSVHPTGMAADLRRSKHEPCRIWLERTLLAEETKGTIEATRERHPPHYHIVVFPKRQLLQPPAQGRGAKALPPTKGPSTTAKTNPATAREQPQKGGAKGGAASAKSQGSAAKKRGDAKVATESYQVGSKESLWLIARRFGTTVDAIKTLNGLEGTQIRPGQTLIVPSKNVAAP